MKTAINTLLATIAITLTASASPALLVETTITEHHAKGGKDVLAAPRITVVAQSFCPRGRTPPRRTISTQ